MRVLLLFTQERAATAGVAGGEDMLDEDDNDSEPPLHRLCPTYAHDINSPLRHVRTRIYFTSESHVHSLINVRRYCHLGGAMFRLQSPCLAALTNPECLASGGMLH